MHTNLEARISKMERSLRIYHVILLLSTLIIVFFVISSFNNNQSVPDRLQAKAFEVVDDYGKVLVKVGAYKNAGSITTFTNQGKTLVYILKNVDGNGTVVGYNSSDYIAYRLTGTNTGSGTLEIQNKLGKPVVNAGSTLSDGGYVTIYNSSGIQVVTTGQTTEQNGVINIYNRYNNRINSMGGDINQNGVFNGWNNSGTKTVQLPN